MSDPVQPREHHLIVERTARYLQLGEAGASTRELWLVAHGYGQLASRFIRVFERVANAQRVVVAPEGLSRFYVEGSGAEGGSPKVGASWMTREDRLHEIADYIAYLDAVYDHLFELLDRGRLRVTALGFSQGVATIVRWLARGRGRAERLILCGGLLPPELDETDFSKLRAMELLLVVGRRDQFAAPHVVAQEESRLRDNGVPFRTIWFDGGHEVAREVVEGL